ncbi:hypothetical protein RhiTH_007226 [Rhizoctonia solani]
MLIAALQSGRVASSDGRATITQKWTTKDLLCPHPFLLERPLSRDTTAYGQQTDPGPDCGLLSTTAFRFSNNQVREQPRQDAHQLRALVVSFLRIWRELRPQDVPRYAFVLRPIVSQIFRMYLRNELVLSMDELDQMRELGRSVIHHYRMRAYSRAIGEERSETNAIDRLADRLRGQHIGIGTRVVINGVNPREPLYSTTHMDWNLSPDRPGQAFN